MLQEDTRGYQLILFASGLTNQTPVASLAGTSAATNNPTVFSAGGTKLTMEALATGIVTLSSKLLVPSKLWINPFTRKDLILFNTTTSGTGGAGIFAPNFQDMALKAGRVGGIMGVDVLESVVVPSSECYVLAPADYLGVLAVRTDLLVETMKDKLLKIVSNIFNVLLKFC